MTDRQEPPGGRDPFDPYSDLSDLAEDSSIPQLEDPSIPPAVPPRSPLLTGLIVALLLIVVSIAVFQLLGDDDTDPGPAASGSTTTTAPTTDPPTDSTETTGPSTGGTEPTATTGNAPATTSDVTPAGFEPYESQGEPIAFDKLRMAVDGLGPVDFGTEAAEAIGRLIASLGTPDEDSGPVVSTGAYGVCEGDMERIVRWGPFVAIVVVDEDGTETFGGYRLDFAYAVEGLGSPATELETLSGLKAGQSVVALKEVYERFEVSFEVDPDLGTTFQLRSASSGNLLLWGPVTSDDSNGIVLGIYAPDACGRF